jgi:hypothetical protein
MTGSEYWRNGCRNRAQNDAEDPVRAVAASSLIVSSQAIDLRNRDSYQAVACLLVEANPPRP